VGYLQNQPKFNLFSNFSVNFPQAVSPLKLFSYRITSLLIQVLYIVLYQERGNISECGGFFMVWLTKSKFLSVSVLGKAIANGYPISVVTGKKEIMMAAESRLFISSTFFPNSDAFIAALKTIEILERDKVLEDIWEKGDMFMKQIQEVLDKYDVGAKLTGIPPMFYITFNKDDTGAYKGKRKDFYTQLIRKGFFFTPFHHAYISYRHTKEDLALTLTAIDDSLAYLKEKY